MALDDERWEAGDWQLDRFDLAAKPVEQSTFLNVGSNIMQMFASKSTSMCQVRVQLQMHCRHPTYSFPPLA